MWWTFGIRMNNIPELDEAELKSMTQNMFNIGGIDNVLSCISTMPEMSDYHITKLNEFKCEVLKKLRRIQLAIIEEIQSTNL